MLDATECGAGGTRSARTPSTPATGAGSFVCSFPDGPARPDVSVTVSDSDGASDSDTLAVTVNNVAPTVTLTGPTRRSTRADAHLQLHDQRSGRGHVHARRDRLRDGRQPGRRLGHVQRASGGSFVCSFPDGPGEPDGQRHGRATPTVRSDSDTLAVTVNNVAPTVAFGSGDLSVDEGADAHLHASRSAIRARTRSRPRGAELRHGRHPGRLDRSTHAGGGSFDCSFPDGPASSTVRVQVEGLRRCDTNSATRR